MAPIGQPWRHGKPPDDRGSLHEPQRVNWKTVAAAAGVVVILTTLLWWPLDGDTKGYAGWLEAVSTFAAFTAALIAAVYVARTYRIEAAREQRFEDAQIRSQAEQVVAWFDPDMPPWAEEAYYEPHSKLVLINGSRLPVFDLHAVIHPPASSGAMPVDLDLSRGLGPAVGPTGDTPIVHEIDIEYGSQAVHDLTRWAHGWWGCELRFRDAANRRWVRTVTGKLEPDCTAV